MNLAFQFGCPDGGLSLADNDVAFTLTNPVIAGDASELWADGIGAGRQCGDGDPAGAAATSCGAWASPSVADGDFQRAAHRLYRDIFRITSTVTLYRIWNFVPRINDADRTLENYRAFCQGRHQAFAESFGDTSQQRMPAASAVGTGGERLCAAFVAGTAPVRYVENPHQVPAYRYPSRYGPRAPSFARASIVDDGTLRRLFVSGTASIRGSESLHPGDVSAQLALAVDNADAVARAAGLDGLSRASAGQRRFRLYLRHPEDWTAARPVFERIHRDGDRFNVVQADICRSELLVEIEACVTAEAGEGVT